VSCKSVNLPIRILQSDQVRRPRDAVSASNVRPAIVQAIPLDLELPLDTARWTQIMIDEDASLDQASMSGSRYNRKNRVHDIGGRVPPGIASRIEIPNVLDRSGPPKGLGRQLPPEHSARLRRADRWYAPEEAAIFLTSQRQLRLAGDSSVRIALPFIFQSSLIGYPNFVEAAGRDAPAVGLG